MCIDGFILPKIYIEMHRLHTQRFDKLNIQKSYNIIYLYTPTGFVVCDCIVNYSAYTIPCYSSICVTQPTRCKRIHHAAQHIRLYIRNKTVYSIKANNNTNSRPYSVWWLQKWYPFNSIDRINRKRNDRQRAVLLKAVEWKPLSDNNKISSYIANVSPGGGTSVDGDRWMAVKSLKWW